MTVTTGRVLDLGGLQDELRGMGVDHESIDYTRGLRAASGLLSAEWEKCFVRQASPDGIPWRPFKRTPGKRRGGRSAKLLIDTGRLMQSGAGRAVKRLDRVSLEQGSDLAYAGYQNFGTRTIPARQFAGVTEEAARKIELLVADDVVRQMGF